MRFLHTGDWHVGKLLRGRSRIAEQEEALAEILRIASDSQVDCLLVCGDLYDSHAPSSGRHRQPAAGPHPRPRPDQRQRTRHPCSNCWGKALKVVGLMNVQYAIAGDKVYVIEVNPRASRTVPFVSKASGVPLAKIAAQLMVGRTLSEAGLSEDLEVESCFVKAPVFPFNKFPGVDTSLGPEMKSTGEVMGVAETFGEAYAKAQAGAGVHLPKSGTVFISVNDRDKRRLGDLAQQFIDLGVCAAEN